MIVQDVIRSRLTLIFVVSEEKKNVKKPLTSISANMLDAQYLPFCRSLNEQTLFGTL